MAYAKKVSTNTSQSKAKVETVSKEEVNEITQTDIQEEKISISKTEFDQMKAQMEMMMKMITMNNSSGNSSKKSDRYITFVNLTKGKFILKGSSIYTIDHQFETRKFIEREAKLIVNNMPNSIQQGKIYILDSDFVKECELEDVYKNLLNDKELAELLNKEPSYVVEVYKNSCDGQKKIILDIIEDKKMNGDFVDANILLEIGKLSGKDLINIESLEEIKEG